MKKIILILFLTFCTRYSSAQNLKINPDTDTNIENKKIDFTVMPYLSYNRNLKFMFGAIPMGMYKLNKNDSISPKSLSGAIGFYTTNKSYFVGLFNKFYFSQDSWRGTLFFGKGDFNSQFFMDEIGVLDFYNYGTNTTILSASIQRKIVKGLYGGITYTYASYNTVFEDSIVEESTTVTNGLGFTALYDTRDNVYYPKTGKRIDVKWINYTEWFGNDMKANKIKTVYNTYFPMRNKTDVLAARFSGTFGLGNLVFEQQTVVGGTDIRGYSEGKYRGNSVIALQGEYRLNFTKRLGMVGFAGAATLYGGDNENFDGTFLPGGGVGVRYGAFKAMKFNIGLDAALGKDDWGIYFRIGEAF